MLEVATGARELLKMRGKWQGTQARQPQPMRVRARQPRKRRTSQLISMRAVQMRGQPLGEQAHELYFVRTLSCRLGGKPCLKQPVGAPDCLAGQNLASCLFTWHRCTAIPSISGSHTAGDPRPAELFLGTRYPVAPPSFGCGACGCARRGEPPAVADGRAAGGGDVCRSPGRSRPGMPAAASTSSAVCITLPLKEAAGCSTGGAADAPLMRPSPERKRSA